MWAPAGDSAREAPAIAFPRVIVEAKTPANHAVRDGQFRVVVHNDQAYWALFRCPCGCGAVISLPLRAPQHPHWECSFNRAGLPSLTPSVWRNLGCMSHFWITDGRVLWCRDTGRAPHEVRPNLYPRNRLDS